MINTSDLFLEIMGQSSSKKQKKQKSEGSFSRKNSTRQSAKHLNNKATSIQKSPLNENNTVKNEIKSTENNSNPVKECENKLNNNSIPPNNRDVENSKISPTRNFDQSEHNDLDEIKPTDTQDGKLDDGSIKDTAEVTKDSSTNDSIIIHKTSDVELRNKDGTPDTIPVKIIRSASTGGEIGHSPMRKMSGRESTEFRRRQFYQQILSNKSLFDTDHVMSRHSTDALPITNKDFYNYSSDIKKYNIEDYPDELKPFAESLDKIETDLKEMSKSQINLYFATMKDDLHNNWRKVFTVNVTDDVARTKKIELINRVKTDLDVLNNRFLGRKLLFVKY